MQEIKLLQLSISIMKTAVLLILFFLFSANGFCQNISLQQITSNNVLSYLQDRDVQQNMAASISQIAQIGDYNLIEVSDFKSEYITISQYGNENTTLFYNSNNYPTNAEIRINGSGNFVEIEGSNSISHGMILTIQANDTAIIMRNQ